MAGGTAAAATAPSPAGPQDGGTGWHRVWCLSLPSHCPRGDTSHPPWPCWLLLSFQPRKAPLCTGSCFGQSSPWQTGSLPTLCHPTPLSHERDPTPRCRRAVPDQIRRERLRGRVVRQRLQGHHGPGANLAPAEPPREEPAQLAAGDAGHAALRPAALPGHRPHRLAEVGAVPRVPAPPPR